jgi:two-component system LytT family response regulator
MERNCLIFDDEPSAIAEIRLLIEKLAPDWHVIGTALQAADCRTLLSLDQADVIFSDIHFGDELVFDLLPELKHFKGYLVFVSGHNNFASQAFELSAINYILKPISEIRFSEAIQKINAHSYIKNNISQPILLHNITEQRNLLKKIAFNTKSGYIIKELTDILFAQSKNNYTEFHFSTGEKLLIAKTLLEYERMLEPFGFHRIHQSYMVNFHHVQRFDTEELCIFLQNGVSLPVSIRRKSTVLIMMRMVF